MNFHEIEKYSLGFFPTPLTELKRLSNCLGGPSLYIKRDDQTGLATGGNKTRKLEYLFADAVKKGCDTVITAGASQSNHCRQTAAAAALSGLNCHLVLGGTEPDTLTGNLLLDNLFNAQIHWAGPYRKGEKIPEIKQELIAKGFKPYVIPYGGSNEIGALGFVNAMKELKEQTSSISNDFEFDYIVFASSSGGTHSGLTVGSKLFDVKSNILGIGIDKGEAGDLPFKEHLADLANKTAKLLSLNHNFNQDDFNLNQNYMGEGYGIVNTLDKDGIKLLANNEGILTDPVYTGRAMGALIDLVRKKHFKSNDKVLFWHTGGAPALFHYGNKIF
ncbi:MAG TPA: D-cysteine desulfhydrase family protein [Victivallales bacterium]|nr:D-cysteine desulfhydrase family protein [Victivallales bacterium]